MEDEKFNEMMQNLIFGAFILFLIMLPSFCFRVDEKQYKELKKEDNERKKLEYLKRLKEKMKEKGPFEKQDESLITKDNDSSNSLLKDQNKEKKVD